MPDEVVKSAVSNNLRAERKRKQLSLDATAKLTGVSKAMLGQIERGESSPTIATLWKIASGLEVSFSAFFANDSELENESASLSGKRLFPEDPRMLINTLFPYQADTGIEVFEVALSEHHQQMSSPHSVGVIEHVHVISGKVSVYFDQQWHELKTGESVRFYSDQPHGYQAITENAVFHNIVSYPNRGLAK